MADRIPLRAHGGPLKGNAMFTNDLKKGMIVRLAGSCWIAVIEDNKKGNIRMATVYGYETEMGSVYAHDIDRVALTGAGDPALVMVTTSGYRFPEGCQWGPIEHTAAQLKLKAQLRRVGL